MTSVKIPIEPTSVQEAYAWIKRIRRKRGKLDKEDLYQFDQTEEQWRAEFLQSQEDVQDEIAQVTKLMAEELYTSNFKFIYEMIQNADDASYTKTRDPPSISFRIGRNDITIDLNEDGFRIQNVQAICSTGLSSKRGATDTIGEKGLGFKSVFAVAEQVSIQSGLWSFYLTYKEGEHGLGMVTPSWFDAEKLPNDVGTRFVLKYQPALSRNLSLLDKEFRELPETIVFALQRLKRVKISIETAENCFSDTVFEKYGTFDDSTIEISRTEGKKTIFSEYKVFKKELDALPVNKKRKCSESSVVLGFPLDQKGRPDLNPDGQHVFAYLPVQRSRDLPFIIQADFILTQNREGIVDKPWNKALREGIVTAFVEAAREFCKTNGRLRYTWMRFLPKSDIINTSVWKGFREELLMNLRAVEAFRTDLDCLKCANSIRIVPYYDFRHEGQPLFPDIPEEDVYVSRHYKDIDLDALESIGVSQLSTMEMIRRLKHDLNQYPSASLLQNTPLADDWHTSVTMFIELCLKDEETEAAVRRLSVIPLASGDWVSPNKCQRLPVYFPEFLERDTWKIHAPSYFNERVLHPVATAFKTRKSVYASLRIEDLPQDEKVKVVFAANLEGDAATIVEVVSHFELLFMLGGKMNVRKERNFIAVNSHGKFCSANTLYFQTDEDFSTYKLLKDTKFRRNKNFGFLHAKYLESKAAKFNPDGLTWREWLRTIMGVRSYPQLVVQKPNSSIVLHAAMKAVIAHNPKGFVGTLAEHWDVSYKYDLLKHPDLRNIIKRVQVLKSDKTPIALEHSRLPTLTTLEKAQEFHVESDLPFIQLFEGTSVEDERKWGFLRDFGVKCDLDLSFYLDVVAALKFQHERQERLAHESEDDEDVMDNSSSEEDGIEDETLLRAIKVYAKIGEISTRGHTEYLKRFFTEHKGIYEPKSRSWVTPASCCWEGFSCLWDMPSVSQYYGQHEEISSLFRDFLGVRNAAKQDLVQQLIEHQKSTVEDANAIGRKGRHYPDHDDIYDVYKALQKLTGTQEDKDLISTFTEHRLIFVDDCWYSPSLCIWTDELALADRVPLAKQYGELEKFFVEVLGVSTTSPDFIISELVKYAKGKDFDVSLLKRLMFASGPILALESNREEFEYEIQRLMTCEFLPVKRDENSWEFEKTIGDFYIIDNESFGEGFRDKVRCLDFSYKDLNSLHPLFEALDITECYISRHVKFLVSAKSYQVDSSLTSHLRQRAYALSCCAVSNHSDCYVSKKTIVHQSLLQAEVFVAKELRTTLVITIGNDEEEAKKTIELETGRAYVKVDMNEQKNTCVVFVPVDEDSRRSCYRSYLPRELAKILKINGTEAVKTIYRIINETDTSLETIMVEEDLPDCDWLEEAEVSESESSEHLSEVSAGHRRKTLPDDNSAVDLESVVSSPLSEESMDLPVEVISGQDDLYQKVLEKVLEQADRQYLGSVGPKACTMDALADAFLSFEPFASTSVHEALGIPSDKQLTYVEHAKIGAAGELFVVKMLQNAGIPDFTLDNWQSRIRHLVNVLPEPEYRDLPRFTAQEIADIMYKDMTDQMEDFLRRNAFGKFPEWHGWKRGEQQLSKDGHETATGVLLAPDDSTGTTEYLIEVKTTAGPCETEFFVSSGQYEMMSEHTLDSAKKDRKVYVLVRVYNILSKNIKVKIFVDPWKFKDKGLHFKTEKYMVTAT